MRRTLALYLLKEEVARPEDALATSVRASYGVAGLPRGSLFLRRVRRDEPEWLTFLKPHLIEQPSWRSTATLSGVLVFKIGGRWFALVFGHGRMLLDPEMVVPDFGLRVAMNSVDPDELRSLDVRTLEELAPLTRRQLARGSSITSFEIDVDRDLLKRLRGRTSDREFADQVAGSDAARITGDVSFADIRSVVRDAYKFYGSTAYRQRFPWVDHVRLITDRAKKAELDERLEAVVSTEPERIDLAAPIVLDEDDFGGFLYLSRDQDPVFEFDFETYLAMKERAPSVKTLRTDRIAVVSAATESPTTSWPVYRALVTELEVAGNRYVISEGQWYEVEHTYAEETEEIVRRYEQTPVTLPAARLREREDAYNERAKDVLGADALLFDKRFFTASQTNDSIEFCDLFVKPRRIVHVKRKSGSSTLSHLFSQGVVSAELLHFDAGFREAVRAALGEHTGFGRAIPATRLSPSTFEVVFAVIAPAPRGDRHFLPFFSQVNFRRAINDLSARGYELALMRVDVE
jgi:uncharacterized protein (TIGR04141 family)